jgi:hypothetical protein
MYQHSVLALAQMPAVTHLNVNIWPKRGPCTSAGEYLWAPGAVRDGAEYRYMKKGLRCESRTRAEFSLQPHATYGTWLR